MQKMLYNYIDSGLFLNISNKDLPVKRQERQIQACSKGCAVQYKWDTALKKDRRKLKAVINTGIGKWTALWEGETRRIICYYAHFYSSRERGSNMTHEDVKCIENWINNYPRKMF